MIQIIISILLSFVSGYILCKYHSSKQKQILQKNIEQLKEPQGFQASIVKDKGNKILSFKFCSKLISQKVINTNLKSSSKQQQPIFYKLNMEVQIKKTRQSHKIIEKEEPQMTSSQKKKNKKKKKNTEKEKNKLLQSIKQEDHINQGQNNKNSSAKKNPSIQGSASKKQQINQEENQKPNSTQAFSQQYIDISRFQKQLISQDIIEKQSQLLSDFIISELQLLKNYFLDELQQIIPFKILQASYANLQLKTVGHYRLTLTGTTKQITMVWKYNNSKYPQQLIEISFKKENLNPLETEKFENILNTEKKNFQNKKFYQFIFHLSTIIFQDLLVSIQEGELEFQRNFQLDDSSSIKKGVKYLNHQKGQNYLHESYNEHNGSGLPQNAIMLTQGKKQIYGRLLDQIFYMQDFKQQPNQSLFAAINPQQSYNKKHYPRGRYINQFDEIQMIGEGGFGKVYRVKNKLDSNTYAVKKIIINYQNTTDRKLLQQVKLLSKLNHPNIVRYHQSWLQDAENIQQLIDDMSLTQAQDIDELKQIYEDWQKSKTNIIFEQIKQKKQKGQSQSDEGQNSDILNQQNYDDNIMFEQDDGIQFQGCSEIGFEHSKRSISKHSNSKMISFSKRSQNKIHENQQSQQSQSEKSQFPFKILYIVMQFCQGINLKQFINKRFHDEANKIQIIRGILEGLVYIHEKKIIHRDLKPANVFLTENNKVKIGDFGLATTGTIQQKIMSYQNSMSSLSQKTVGIGTAFYRAPQQLVTTKYDQKVDIYSLGIIIFQMFYQFGTYSERFKILSDITKTFKLPKDFNLYGQISDYELNIEKCIKSTPEDRPSARKLLDTFRNKYFVHLVSAIANPKYTQFFELIKHLFEITNQRGSAIKKNLFRPYDYLNILKIYSVHRGNLFTSLPFVLINDHKTLNSVRIPTSRKQKFLFMSQQGVIFQYATNTYNGWIVYAKQSMKRKKQQIRRFTFQKVVDSEYFQKKEQYIYKERLVSGFDIAYDLQNGFRPFLTFEMLVISNKISQTLYHQDDIPNLYLCHTKIYEILAKQFKISVNKLYSCILSTTQQQMKSLPLAQKIKVFQKNQIQGDAARKICEMLQKTFDSFNQFIQELSIINVSDYPEYHEILYEFESVLQFNKYFKLQNLKWKLQIPQNSGNGIYWTIGYLKGFTSIQQLSIDSYMCNLNLQIALSHCQEECNVSIWSNGQFLEDQILEAVAKCWQNGVSAKWYDQSIGQKDQTSKNNIIIVKKKKGQRIYYQIRKNQGKKNRSQELLSKQSSLVLKQQFDFQALKQLNNFSTTIITMKRLPSNSQHSSKKHTNQN